MNKAYSMPRRPHDQFGQSTAKLITAISMAMAAATTRVNRPTATEGSDRA